MKIDLKPKTDEALDGLIGPMIDDDYIITIDGVIITGAKTYREVEAMKTALLTATWYGRCDHVDTITVYHPYKGLKGCPNDVGYPVVNPLTDLDSTLLIPALERGEQVWGVEVIDYDDEDGSPFIDYLIGVDAKTAFERYTRQSTYTLHKLTLTR
jgi:hypothetical protein